MSQFNYLSVFQRFANFHMSGAVYGQEKESCPTEEEMANATKQAEEERKLKEQEAQTKRMKADLLDKGLTEEMIEKYFDIETEHQTVDFKFPTLNKKLEIDVDMCTLKTGIVINGKHINTIDELVYILVTKPQIDKQVKLVNEAFAKGFNNNSSNGFNTLMRNYSNTQ